MGAGPKTPALQPQPLIEEPGAASASAAISASRRSCEQWSDAHNLSETKQLRFAFEHADLMEHNRLGLMLECDPPGETPPCVMEGLFHLPSGFEKVLDNRRGVLHEQRYQQCRTRRTDADWPTLDPFAQRSGATRTITDVMRVLGDRVVTIVGASTSIQLFEAVQCSLASAGLSDRMHQWKHWGWATFSADSGRRVRSPVYPHTRHRLTFQIVPAPDVFGCHLHAAASRRWRMCSTRC